MVYSMYNEVLFNTIEEGLAAYEYPCALPEVIMCTVHGIGEHFGRYERMAAKLSTYGIKMIGMDLRGHGRTEGKAGHCAPRGQVLSDIDAMIKYAVETYEGIPIVLYGHSMGGNIVLDYRHRGRFGAVPKAYVVSAPWIHLVRNVPGVILGVVKLLSKISPELTMGSAVDESLLGYPESVLPYNDDPLVHNRISMQTAVEGFTIGNRLYRDEWFNDGEGLERPLLLMHGSEDRICDVNGSRKIAENEGEICQYVEWEGYYHEIHNGGAEVNGDAVIDKIGQWITETVK